MWTFLNDQPVAISSKDGSTLADRVALERQNPELRGIVVVHRTPLDEEGRIAFTRLDDYLKAQWTATFPFHDLHNRFQSPGHLLLYGVVQGTVKGVTGWTEHLVALDLSNGQMQGWNVQLEQAESSGGSD